MQEAVDLPIEVEPRANGKPTPEVATLKRQLLKECGGGRLGVDRQGRAQFIRPDATKAGPTGVAGQIARFNHLH